MSAEKSNVIAFVPKPKRLPQQPITRELVAKLRPEAQHYDQRDSKLKGFLVRVSKSGVMSYAVEVGRGKRVTLGNTEDLKTSVARHWAEIILGNAVAGRDLWAGIEERTGAAKKTDGPTLGEFVAGEENPDETDVLLWNGKFAEFKRPKQKARPFKENLQRVKLIFGGLWNKELTAITKDDLNKIRAVRSKINADASVRRDLTRLQGVLTFARKHHKLKNDAFEDYELPDDSDNRVRYLGQYDDGERKRLMAALGLDSTPDYLRVMVLVSLNTGLRRGELFQLRWPSINVARRFLTVRSSTSKTDKERHVGINEKTLKVLLDWKPAKPGTGLVFPNGDGEEFDNVKKSFATLIEHAEIEDFHWHDMRHDFASQLVIGGKDLYVVKKLLGHAKIETTEKYAHLAPKLLTEAVDMLDAL